MEKQAKQGRRTEDAAKRVAELLWEIAHKPAHNHQDVRYREDCPACNWSMNRLLNRRAR